MLNKGSQFILAAILVCLVCVGGTIALFAGGAVWGTLWTGLWVGFIFACAICAGALAFLD